MSVWQIQIHQTTVQNGASGWIVPVENWLNIQRFKYSNDFGIADDILTLGYDADDRDLKL